MSTSRLFGTSGIRGVVNQDLSPEFCHQVALGIGTSLPQASTVCIATDTRTSRDLIKEAVTSGLLSTGINVVDLGIVPTPALALLTRELRFAAGIMVTASHNPPEFNGIKLFTGDSLGYSQAQEAEVERIYSERDFRQANAATLEKAAAAKDTYFEYLTGKFSGSALKNGLKIVVDPGNGAASGFASDIFARMGLDVIPINDQPDGLFPGRSPGVGGRGDERSHEQDGHRQSGASRSSQALRKVFPPVHDVQGARREERGAHGRPCGNHGDAPAFRLETVAAGADRSFVGR